MNILFLGSKNSNLVDFLVMDGNEVFIQEDKFDTDYLEENNIEFVVSFGYRYIIGTEIIEALPHRLINLHISYLPYNKGADPNFWSFYDNTPKGVTIHEIQKGLDTGGILLQEELELTQDETLRTSYEKLKNCIEALFMDRWADLKSNKIKPIPQTDKGTYHRSADKAELIAPLGDFWMDVKISDLLATIKD